MADIQLRSDELGGDSGTIHIRNSKKDKFGDCDFGTLKSADGGAYAQSRQYLGILRQNSGQVIPRKRLLGRG